MAADHANKKQKVSTESNNEERETYTSLLMRCKEMKYGMETKEAVFALGVLRFPNSLSKYIQEICHERVALSEYDHDDHSGTGSKMLLTTGFGHLNKSPRLIPDDLIISGRFAMTFEHETGDSLHCTVSGGASLEIICDNPSLEITLLASHAKLIKVRGKCKSIKIRIFENSLVPPLIDCSAVLCSDILCSNETYNKMTTTFVIFPSGEKKIHISTGGDNEEWLTTRITGSCHQVNFPQPCYLREIKDNEGDGFISYFVTH